eukprot:PhF_6_TR12239/c0_g1_i1/m.19378
MTSEPNPQPVPTENVPLSTTPPPDTTGGEIHSSPSSKQNLSEVAKNVRKAWRHTSLIRRENMKKDLANQQQQQQALEAAEAEAGGGGEGLAMSPSRGFRNRTKSIVSPTTLSGGGGDVSFSATPPQQSLLTPTTDDGREQQQTFNSTSLSDSGHNQLRTPKSENSGGGGSGGLGGSPSVGIRGGSSRGSTNNNNVDDLTRKTFSAPDKLETLIADARNRIQGTSTGNVVRQTQSKAIANLSHWEPLLQNNVYETVELLIDETIQEEKVTRVSQIFESPRNENRKLRERLFNAFIQGGGARAMAIQIRREVSELPREEIVHRLIHQGESLNHSIKSILKERLPWVYHPPHMRTLLWREEVGQKLFADSTMMTDAMLAASPRAVPKGTNTIVDEFELQSDFGHAVESSGCFIPYDTESVKTAIAQYCEKGGTYHSAICYLMLPVAVIRDVWELENLSHAFRIAMMCVWSCPTFPFFEGKCREYASRCLLFITATHTGRDNHQFRRIIAEVSEAWLRVGFVGYFRFDVVEYLWDQLLVLGTSRVVDMLGIFWEKILSNGPVESDPSYVLLDWDLRDVVTAFVHGVPCFIT